MLSLKQKYDLCTNFNSVWWKWCVMFACHFDKNLFALLCLKGFVIAIVKTKVYCYNKLRSELVYILLLQPAGLEAGTK
jgi:hypothetical protein